MPDVSRSLPPDIEIARKAPIRPIEKIAARLGIGADDLEHYGKYKAKVSLDLYHRLKDKPTGKLILVTAITPTPAGEGKTTTSIGLCDGLNRIGKQASVCLREPSLGPCFGMKGGAAGGGNAQVIPMEDINLHFTGDFHAIELAHNLLAAMLDNHIHHGNALGIDLRRIVWKRVLDMNDRALRNIIVGLGGVNNSMPREDGFDITVASEVMACFCLSESLAELRERLGRIIVAYNRDRKPITAADLKAHGAMTVLLEGGPQAEPRADARRQSGLHPRRAVRQYRPRLQQRAGHEALDAALGVHGHRGRLRRRPGGREVHEHQVPQGRHQARRRGHRGHRAGPEVARRRAAQGAVRSPTSRPWTRASRISRSTSRTSTASACRWSWPSTTSPTTPTRRSSSFATSAPIFP